MAERIPPIGYFCDKALDLMDVESATILEPLPHGERQYYLIHLSRRINDELITISIAILPDDLIKYDSGQEFARDRKSKIDQLFGIATH